MNRPAFSIIEVLLYIAVFIMVVPLTLSSIRLVGRLYQQTQILMFQALYHRAAFNTLLRDASRASEHKVASEVITLKGFNYSSAGKQQKWRIQYECRKSGLYRVQQKTIQQKLVRSSNYLAPPLKRIVIKPCGDKWMRLVYEWQSGVGWEQVFYCWGSI